MQDRKAKHQIDDANYITKEVLVGWVGKSCNSCGDCLIYDKVAVRWIVILRLKGWIVMRVMWCVMLCLIVSTVIRRCPIGSK